MITETFTVERGKTDPMSKRTNTTHTVEGIFSWGIGSRGAGRFGFDIERQESATIAARVYVKRGSDVKARDRILRSNGELYAVVGHPLWDQASPFTGRNFGWMTLQLESANG